MVKYATVEASAMLQHCCFVWLPAILLWAPSSCSLEIQNEVCNLLSASWGLLQGQQLHIRSFELSVLFTPALLATAARHPHFGFKATTQPEQNPLHGLHKLPEGPGDAGNLADITFWPLNHEAPAGDNAAYR